MSGTISGKVVEIYDQQQVTDTFAKREFVIETDEQYPQSIKFECTQGRIDELEIFELWLWLKLS